MNQNGYCQIRKVTVLYVYQNGHAASNLDVLKDINEIRRINANRVLRERFGGVVKAMADHLDIAPGFVSRVLNSQSANAKNIGDSLARRIESIGEHELNWLDHDHDRPADALPIGAMPEGLAADSAAGELIARYAASPPDVQALIRLALNDPQVPIDHRVRPSLQVMLEMVRTQIRLHLPT